MTVRALVVDDHEAFRMAAAAVVAATDGFSAGEIGGQWRGIARRLVTTEAALSGEAGQAARSWRIAFAAITLPPSAGPMGNQ